MKLVQVSLFYACFGDIELQSIEFFFVLQAPASTVFGSIQSMYVVCSLQYTACENLLSTLRVRRLTLKQNCIKNEVLHTNRKWDGVFSCPIYQVLVLSSAAHHPHHKLLLPHYQQFKMEDSHTISSPHEKNTNF